MLPESFRLHQKRCLAYTANRLYTLGMTFKSIKITLLLVGGLIIAAAPAYACSCMPLNTIPEVVDATPVIFKGKVKKTKRRFTLSSFETHTTTFEVIETFKGSAPSYVSVMHGKNGASCGVSFPKKQDVFVYAYKDEKGNLATNSCSYPHNFENIQIVKFIETGLDTSELNVFCRWQIRAAYEKQSETGVFKLESERCAAAVPHYDELYKD